jgi:hypothetical protein
MRLSAALLILGMMSGCTVVPPKPPECRGEFRPVNQPHKEAVSADGKVKLVRCGEGEPDGRQG